MSGDDTRHIGTTTATPTPTPTLTKTIKNDDVQSLDNQYGVKDSNNKIFEDSSSDESININTNTSTQTFVSPNVQVVPNDRQSQLLGTVFVEPNYVSNSNRNDGNGQVDGNKDTHKEVCLFIL